QRSRIGDALTRDVRRRSVHRFKHRALLADVRAGNESQAADKTRAKIGNDVAVKILEQHDVKLLGTHHQLHTRVVDNLVVSDDIGIVLTHLAETLEKQTIGKFHDVCLVDRGHFLSPLTLRVFECEARDSRRCLLSDDLYTLNHARHDDVLQPRVQTLCVLTHDDEIKLRVTTRHIRQRAYGPQVCVEIERFSKSDVDRSEAFTDRSGDWSLQSDLVAQYRIEQILRQSLAEFFERLRARVMCFPLDLDARGFDDS